MNIHPLFVHFPIGILVLYSAFEILRFKFIVKRSWYFDIKAVLVIIGTTAAYITASTGELAEEIIEVSAPEKLNLVEIHSMYAAVTIAIFSVLAYSYLFVWLKKSETLKAITKITALAKLSQSIQKYSPLIALFGFIALTVTGGLGASIVYGPEVDPVVTFIYNIFVHSI